MASSGPPGSDNTPINSTEHVNHHNSKIPSMAAQQATSSHTNGIHTNSSHYTGRSPLTLRPLASRHTSGTVPSPEKEQKSRDEEKVLDVVVQRPAGCLKRARSPGGTETLSSYRQLKRARKTVRFAQTVITNVYNDFAGDAAEDSHDTSMIDHKASHDDVMVESEDDDLMTTEASDKNENEHEDTEIEGSASESVASNTVSSTEAEKIEPYIPGGTYEDGVNIPVKLHEIFKKELARQIEGPVHDELERQHAYLVDNEGSDDPMALLGLIRSLITLLDKQGQEQNALVERRTKKASMGRSCPLIKKAADDLAMTVASLRKLDSMKYQFSLRLRQTAKAATEVEHLSETFTEQITSKDQQQTHQHTQTIATDVGDTVDDAEDDCGESDTDDSPITYVEMLADYRAELGNMIRAEVTQHSPESFSHETLSEIKSRLGQYGVTIYGEELLNIIRVLKWVIRPRYLRALRTAKRLENLKKRSEGVGLDSKLGAQSDESEEHFLMAIHLVEKLKDMEIDLKKDPF